MSYILEALKKSDQQRQIGATPTLQAAQVTGFPPKRPVFIYYGLLAVVLLGAGILIGWLRPWQTEPTRPETNTMAANSPTSIFRESAPEPSITSAAAPGKNSQELTATNEARSEQPDSAADAKKIIDTAGVNDNTASVRSVTTVAEIPEPEKTLTDIPASPGGATQEQQAISLEELPIQIQRELPAMTVQLHAYSSNPSERLVSINSIRLREGESLMLGLRLEQITPDGMIFSYKGYRFKRGTR